MSAAEDVSLVLDSPVSGLPEPAAAADRHPTAAEAVDAGEQGTEEPAKSGSRLTVEQVGDIEDLLRRPMRVHSRGIRLLSFLAIVYTLFLARSFFIGVAFALILKIAMAPMVRGLARLRIPPAIGAGIVLLAVCGAVGVTVTRLAEPAGVWVSDLPRKVEQIRLKLRPMHLTASKVSALSEGVEALSDEVGELTNGRDQGRPLEVRIAPTASVLARLSHGVWSLAGDLLITMVLLYFLLATDDSFLRKLVEVLPRLRDKKLAVETVRAIESRVSHYLLTVGLINIGLGVVLTLAFAALKLPNPALWGAMAALLNMVPYLGSMLGIGIVACVSLLSHDAWQAIVAAPLAYLLATSIEGMLVTPMILGRSLTLSPVAIFLWLLLWTMLWGIPGALLAVPMLAAVKIVCENIPSLRPFGVFLGE